MTQPSFIAQGKRVLEIEAQALQDRMSALYEDMGQILNRYFTINDAAKEGKNYRQHGDEKEED